MGPTGQIPTNIASSTPAGATLPAAATVPTDTGTDQQSTAAEGLDTITQLIKSANDADKRAAQLAQAATVPVAGGHAMPQNIVMPGAGHNYIQRQLDLSPVYGHHQATMQGIANLTKAIGNVVGQVQQAKDEKKTQQLSVNIEHLMTAINSADQAKQVLAQDPNNAAAKQQLQQANKIADEVLSDDKNRKAIAKAFQIDFTDPSKNTAPEHAALKQAQQSYAQQFAAKLPQQMAPNQQAIAAAQSAALEAKAMHESVDKIIPVILQGQSAERRVAAQQAGAIQREQERTKMLGRIAQMNMNKTIQAAKILAGSRIYEADVGAYKTINAAIILGNSRLQVAQDKLTAMANKGFSNMTPKELISAMHELETEKKDIGQSLLTYNTLSQDKGVVSAGRQDLYYQAAHDTEDSLGVINDMMDQARQELKRRGTIGAGTTTTGSSQTDTGTSTGDANYQPSAPTDSPGPATTTGTGDNDPSSTEREDEDDAFILSH